MIEEMEKMDKTGGGKVLVQEGMQAEQHFSDGGEKLEEGRQVKPRCLDWNKRLEGRQVEW